MGTTGVGHDERAAQPLWGSRFKSTQPKNAKRKKTTRRSYHRLQLEHGYFITVPWFECRNDFWVWYAAYTSSRYWKDLRDGVIRTRKCCELCGDNDRLTVHHQTYERLGRELPADLQLLCFKCHRGVHWAISRLDIHWFAPDWIDC